jgi:hypothetical protein
MTTCAHAALATAFAPPPHMDWRCADARACTRARRDSAPDKRKLEKYFADHQIQDKLNGMLNELVQVRPSAPFGWLARRMRRDGSGQAPAGTVPLLKPEIGSAMGRDLEKQWGFTLGLQNDAPSAPPKGGASAKQARAGANGVQLTIETAGQGVLLCIRPDH